MITPITAYRGVLVPFLYDCDSYGKRFVRMRARSLFHLVPYFEHAPEWLKTWHFRSQIGMCAIRLRRDKYSWLSYRPKVLNFLAKHYNVHMEAFDEEARKVSSQSWEGKRDIQSYKLREGLTLLVSVYTREGVYVGDPNWALNLLRRGIAPELAHETNKICSIGFCEKDRKWYGWSHRAMFGFAIGHVVKPGDCGYQPKDKEDFRLDCIRFWDDGDHEKVHAFESFDSENRPGVQVQWQSSQDIPHERLPGKISGVFYPYPDVFGRGEWTAQTLTETRQMAIDFADGVS